MAANAPDKKDLSVLTPGMPRSMVVAELGSPAQSRTRDDRPVDVFTFKQGYTPVNKFGRTLFHTVADVATWCLWEFAATPLESTLQGEDVRVEVAYDSQECVERIEYFAGAWLADGGPTKPAWMGGPRREVAVIGSRREESVMQASGTRESSPDDQ